MKLSPFLRSFLQVFHESPDDAGGGGGNEDASGAGGAAPSLVDQVLASIAGGQLLTPEEQAAGGDEVPEEVVEEPGTEKPPGNADDKDWISRLPAHLQGDVRERMARLEGENAALRGVAKPPKEEPAAAPAVKDKAVNPLAKLATFEDVDKAEARAEYWRDWAWMNADGGTVKDAEGNDIEITAEAARKMFLTNDAILRKHVPARRAELDEHEQRAAKQEQTVKNAETIYPWLAKKESPEHVLYTKLTNALPELKAKFADAPLFVADMVAGFLARQAKIKAGAGKGAGAGELEIPEAARIAAAGGKPTGGTPVPRTRPAQVPNGGNAGGGRGGPRAGSMTIQELAAGGGTRQGVAAYLADLYDTPDSQA